MNGMDAGVGREDRPGNVDGEKERMQYYSTTVLLLHTIEYTVTG
jgi:hypothetical protein